MIQLSTDPQVLIKLQQAFTAPANSASRALAKYLKVLEGQILSALQRAQSPTQVKLGLFYISLHDLANKGGQIGAQKMRVHKWLKDNQLELVETVEIGSKFKSQYSLVKLSRLVSLHDKTRISSEDIAQIASDRELNSYLTGEPKDSVAVFKHLYPELEPLSGHGCSERFDFLNIDVESLKAFICWLGQGASFGSTEKLRQVTTHAKLILAVAVANGGVYPQRRKVSPFGRTYYQGVSVQNIHKELRTAALGNCWEYDMRSSVVAWKMGYAKQLLVSKRVKPLVKDYFPATTLFLEDKADFMNTVRYFTFIGNESLTVDFQTALIKQALTAISFGAKSSGNGWMARDGTWKNPALVEILKNQKERGRFLSDRTVLAFIEEQKALDEYIFSAVVSSKDELLKLDCIKTQSGRLSKSKVLSYLYQHAETQAMNYICDLAAQHQHAPIARVHDAVFFKSRLGSELKHELEMALRDFTQNEYWHLTAKQLKRYTPVSIDARTEEAEHKTRIQEEERRASEYFAHLSID
jgi:hypothetical protein